MSKTTNNNEISMRRYFIDLSYKRPRAQGPRHKTNEKLTTEIKALTAETAEVAEKNLIYNHEEPEDHEGEIAEKKPQGGWSRWDHRD